MMNCPRKLFAGVVQCNKKNDSCFCCGAAIAGTSLFPLGTGTLKFVCPKCSKNLMRAHPGVALCKVKLFMRIYIAFICLLKTSQRFGPFTNSRHSFHQYFLSNMTFNSWIMLLTGLTWLLVIFFQPY